MEIRESGMPEEALWAQFFSPEEILNRLAVPQNEVLADMGAGYGTFTLPAAERSRKKVYAVDCESEFLSLIKSKARARGQKNIQTVRADILDEAFRLPEPAGGIFLFNLLHTAYPARLLKQVTGNLRPGGRVFVLHWRTDRETPRGPSREIRPDPETIRVFFREAGGREEAFFPAISPYHYGFSFRF